MCECERDKMQAVQICLCYYGITQYFPEKLWQGDFSAYILLLVPKKALMA